MTMTAAKKKLNTIREAADQLGYAHKTIRNHWIPARRIGFVRLGRSIRIPQEEIDKLIEEGMQPAQRSA